jgi:asparagine synthase (glutamine-hydrolysing)
MLRYLGLVWDHDDPDALAFAREVGQLLHGGRLACDQAGLKVYIWAPGVGRASGSVSLSGETGVIVGDLFARTSQATPAPASAVMHLNERATTQIAHSAGRSLLSSYWGRYVAFVRSPDSTGIFVLRDPTGRLPCYITSFRGVHVVFSDIEDVHALGCIHLTVNWHYIRIRTIASVAETHDTPLREVSNVAGGECVSLWRDRMVRSLYWRPTDFVSPLNDDIEQAATELRATMKMCVQTWAQKHQSVLSMLSGGLDSSIVSACLAERASRSRVTCLNLHSHGARSDERDFARLVAAQAQVQLIEEERDPRINLTSMLSLPRTTLPFHYPYKLEIAEVQTRVAASGGATAIFDGNGGDGIFYATPIEPTLRDYRYQHGVGREFFNVALDVARHEQASLWSVLRKSHSQLADASTWDPLTEAYRYRRLVRRDVVDEVRRERRFLHPWLQQIGAMPPGKLWHIFYMSVPLNFDHQIGGSEDCELVLPIISQPIFELLLRVPTYQLTRGGRDRALARQAFAADLPTEVVNRRSKGFREEFTRSILERNFAFVREMLLGGMLVQNGILDVAKLEEVLSGRPDAVGASTSEVFSHLSLEVWLRSCGQQRRRAAA